MNPNTSSTRTLIVLLSPFLFLLPSSTDDSDTPSPANFSPSDPVLLNHRLDGFTHRYALSAYTVPSSASTSIFNRLTVVDTGVGDFVILDQFGGPVRLHHDSWYPSCTSSPFFAHRAATSFCSLRFSFC